MQNVLSWTKANPISVASIAVAIVAIVVLMWVHLSGNAFVAQMSQKQSMITQIDQYMNGRVEVPGLTPNDPPRSVGPITINEPAIEQLQAVFAKMESEYRQVIDEARKINRPGHTPMLPNLFPTPVSEAPFRAKDAYPRALQAMLGGTPEGGAVNDLPLLNAKPPLQAEVINAELTRIEQQYRADNGIQPQGGFEPDQFEQLRKLKSNAVREMMLNHARTLSMYALVDPIPFDIPSWVGEPGAPNEVAMWNGQMMLWIQQDIAAAISAANQVDEPGRDVTQSVVKRLISMKVVPGSVGIRNPGGLAMSGGAGGYNDTGFTGASSSDSGTTPPVTVAAADVRLPNDFAIAPTGRSSNALYDVWHVWVEFVGDSRELPIFFNALAQVNFMTVLTMEVTDVDEYEALREGYVYGPSDAVHVKMLVETIWLRDWTSRLMPDAVKQRLGIATAEEG